MSCDECTYLKDENRELKRQPTINPNQVTIKFPTEELATQFIEWMNAEGEQYFYDVMDIRGFVPEIPKYDFKTNTITYTGDHV